MLKSDSNLTQAQGRGQPDADTWALLGSGTKKGKREAPGPVMLGSAHCGVAKRGEQACGGGKAQAGRRQGQANLATRPKREKGKIFFPFYFLSLFSKSVFK